MATVTSLNYYSFAFNGFVFGGGNSPYQILSLNGLEDLPQIRNQDDNRGYADGMFTGNDFLSGRSLTMTVQTLSSNGTYSISGATATGTGTISYTTSSAHNFITGQYVTITGVLSTGNPTGTAGAGFNRSNQYLTVTGASSFTIPVTLTDTYTSGGVASMSSSAQNNLNLLQAALLPQTSGTTVLQFQLSPSGGLQRLNARVRGNVTPVTPEYTYGLIKSTFTFFSADPRYYDDNQQTATLSVGNPLGRTYNRIYPLAYGGGSSASTTTVTNAGWATTYPVITFNGPATNPIFGNTTQGNYIGISGTYSSSDQIIIDLDQKLVTLNGSSARNLLIGGSNWFSAPPGSNQFYLTGSSTLVGTTSATVTWRNAYI